MIHKREIKKEMLKTNCALRGAPIVILIPTSSIDRRGREYNLFSIHKWTLTWTFNRPYSEDTMDQSSPAQDK